MVKVVAGGWLPCSIICILFKLFLYQFNYDHTCLFFYVVLKPFAVKIMTTASYLILLFVLVICCFFDIVLKMLAVSINYDYIYGPALRRYYRTSPYFRYPFEVNYDYGYGPASRKAQRISQYLTDDHDTLRSHSRAQDAALLRDITSRMEEASFRHPAAHVSRRSRARSPVTIVTSASTSRGRRASSVPPHFRETQFDEEEFFLPRPSTRSRYLLEDWTPYYYKPITSYVSHQVRHRAGSEPPIDRTSTVYTGAAQRYTTPSADLAVRQARGALGRLERELSSGWDDPYYYDTEDYHYVPVRPYRQASMVGLTTTVPPIRSYSPVRSISPIRSYSTVTRTPSLPRRSRAADIEARVEAMIVPEVPRYYAGLRSRAAEARSKMDKHKLMLDRYLPLSLGPEKEVGWWHRRLRGGHRCRTLGSAPVKYYVRRNVTPGTTIIKVLYANPSYGAWSSPLGYVAHTMRCRVPPFSMRPYASRFYLERYPFLPFTYFLH